MKKLLSKVMTLLFIQALCITLTGCGAQKKEITAVLDTFFTAMQNGDWDTARSICEEDVLENLSFSGTLNMESVFYETIGIEKEKLNTQAQTSVSDFIKDIQNNLVLDYRINKLKVSKGVGTANVTITTCVYENADFLNGTGLTSEISDLMETYAQENMDTLLQIYNTQGEEGMLIAMLNDMLPTLMNTLTEAYATSGTTENTFYLKVINRDGKWMITNS